jgi:hypothetical protein
MKAAIINESTNEVVNVIELEPGAIWEAPAGHRVKFSEEAKIGDLYVDTVFIPAE